MEELDESFFTLVSSSIRAIALESKDFLNKAPRCSEDDLVESVRSLSVKTHKLWTLISVTIERHNIKYNRNTSFQQTFTIESCKKVLSALLDFVRGTRSVFVNPYDFLSQQQAANLFKELLIATKQLVSTLDPLKISTLEEKEDFSDELDEDFQLEQSDPAQNPQHKGVPFDIMRDVKIAREAADQIQRSIDDRDVTTFYQAARLFVVAINQLFAVLMELHIPMEEVPLRDASVSFVSAGNVVLKGPLGDISCLHAFTEAIDRLREVLKMFVFACSRSKQGRQSIRLSMRIEPLAKPGPSGRNRVGTVTGIPTVDNPSKNNMPRPRSETSLKASNSFSASDSVTSSPPLVSKSPSTPAAHPDSPTMMKSLAAWERSNKQGSRIGPSVVEAPEVGSARRRAGKDFLSPKPISRSSSSGSIPSPSSSAESSPNAIREVVVNVNHLLAEQYPRFREELANQSPSEREKKISAVVSDVMTRSPSSRFPMQSPPAPPTPPSDDKQFVPPINERRSLPVPPKQGNSIVLGSSAKTSPRVLPSRSHEELLSPKMSASSHSLSHSQLQHQASSSEDSSFEKLKDIIKLSTSLDWITSGGKSKTDKRKPLGQRNTILLAQNDKVRKLEEIVTGLQTTFSGFLELVNSGVLLWNSLSKTTSSSEAGASSVKSIYSHIRKMQNTIKEALQIALRDAEDLPVATPSSMGGSEKDSPESSRGLLSSLRRPGKGDRQLVRSASTMTLTSALHEFLQESLSNTISVFEDEVQGKSVDSVVKSLTAVAHNYINIKLKIEDTLRECLFSECEALRNAATHIIVELKSPDFGMPSALFELGSSARVFCETIGRFLDALETLKFVTWHATENMNEMTRHLNVHEVTDVNIWDDTSEVLSLEGKGFRAGNLNQIVLNLTSEETYEASFLSTFIATYQSFTTPAELFTKLVQRYDALPDAKGNLRLVRMRVCILLKYWIENQFRDLDENLVHQIEVFLNRVQPTDGVDVIAASLKKQLHEQVAALAAGKMSTVTSQLSQAQLSGVISPSLVIMNATPAEIARQLTLIEFDLFLRIQPSELIGQAWNGSQAFHKSPHVLRLIQRTNHLSFWVASLLLWQPDVSTRSKTLAKIIHVGQQLKELNNFNTLMGIVAGLSMSCVDRLKGTFSSLERKNEEILERLQQSLNPGSSFKVYRAELNNAKGACLPYLGTYLSDLTFMEDGNPNTVPGVANPNDKLINFTKRELINGVIAEIKLKQQTPYTFPPVEPLFTFLGALPFLKEKELFELSLLREPRAPKVVAS